MTTRLHWRAVCLLALLCTILHLSSTDNHLDPSAPEQGVTFSHVYKIDIPGSPTCKLERLPAQDEAGLQTESTTNGQNDIIFRHNIRLQTPQCDCGDSESFKALLYRINGLEEEVNYLKTQCSQGCCGRGGAAGVDTSCSGHGTYQHDTCSCLCNPGWEGPDCSVSSCPDECNDNGRCVDGKCVCHQGYKGEDCSQLMCPDNCNDKGHCVDGKCVCFPHFTGEDCSIQKCPNDCSGNGKCVDGQCICEEGFYGEDCSLVFGPEGLQLVQVSDVSLLVEWESVRGAEYYILTYHPKDDESSLEKVRIPNTKNSYLITGLTPGITYIVKVYAVIKEIQSEADKIEATTDVSAIDDIRVLRQTEVSIQVDWKNPPAEVDHFRLTYTDPLGQEDELIVQRSQEARTKHTIMGLNPGTEYLISVQAIRGTTKGKLSSVTDSTDIDAPTNLVVTEVTEDTATVSWDQVQAEIDGYMLSYITADGSSSDIPVGRDSTSYRLIGLRPGVLHTVYIWAYKGEKVSRKASTETETELDAPTNVIGQDETESSFRLSWDPVQAEIDGYKLTYSSSEGSSEEIQVGPDSTSYMLTGLRPGVLYTVHIWVTKGDKVSRKISTQAETVLDAPANLLAQDETESSFRLSWDPVQGEIDGYKLTYSSSEGSSEEIPVGPDSTSYVLTGLRPGVVYTVHIWVTKGDKVSRKISTQAQTVLDAPANLLAQDETESSFRLSWDPVQGEIDGYKLTYSSSEGSSEEIPVGPDSTSYMLTGLRPGVVYTVHIWVIKGDKVSRKISTQAQTELDAPANLLAQDETESSFRLSWDPVQAEIDGYKLTYSSSEGSSEEIQVGPDSTSYVLTGLRPGVVYTVHIWVIKGDKVSRKISTQAQTVLDAPANLLAQDETESSFRLSWDPVQGEIDGYKLTYSSSEGSSEEIPVGPESTSYMLTGLRPGVVYTVHIWVTKGDKVSRKISTQAQTELDAPANLLAQDETESSFRLSWDPVQAEIDGYKLTYSSSEGSSEEIPVGPDSTSYVLTGLRPGVVYTVHIWVIKGDKVSRKISTQAETELDAPANLLAQDETESSFRLSWDPVQGEIDGYKLTYSSSEGSSEEIPVGPEGTSYMLTGLRPGVLYTVYIWSIKGDKVSRKISTQAQTELDAPANLLAQDETESSFRLSWDPVQGEIDGYKLTYSSSEGSSEEIQVGPDSTSYMLTGLRPGVLYTVYIWATKGDKVSRKISTQAQTELDAPANLLAQDETESSFRLSWDPVQAEIDGYKLTYSSSEGSSEEIPVGPDSTSYMLTGLRPGVLYTVHIWVIKGNKVSRKISTQAQTELDAPANLLAQDETESSFRLSWDPVQGEIDGYKLTYSSSEGSSEEIQVGPDSTSYMLTGLRPGVLYTVYIWAIKGNRVSRKISTQAETELDAPANLLAQDETESSFRLSWDPVQAEIDGYKLTYSSSEGSSEEIQVGPDSTSYSLTGLRPGVLYTVYIWAIKGNRVSRKISTQAETDIDAPKDLKATDVTLESASLTWIPPLADIEGYILTYRDEDGNMETVEKQLGASERSFAVSSLEMGKRYIVTITAYRGNKRSKVVETLFRTVGLLYPFPMDCLQIMRNGNKRSGIYTVYINSDRSKPIDAYCDMETDGGGWLMLQRRTTGKLDFMKRWKQYIAGFGDMTDEFWIGLDKIYELTNTPTQYELRFDLGLGSERAYAVYDNFQIAPARQKFRLTIGKYSGTAGDAMTYHQGRPWTTVDSDNDIALGNCALTHRGAWWYKNCHLANLNGRWGDSRHSMGVNWEPWKGHLTSLDFTEMKIRPLGALSSRKRRWLMAREKSRKTNFQKK